jgi:hypothetical protein
MGFDDRTADRQPKSQVARFGGVESPEEVLKGCCRKSRTRIADRDEYTVRSGLAAADEQLARPLAQGAHGFDGVDDQVQDHLLQLGPVSLNGRQAIGRFRPHQDAVLNGFAADQLNHIADRRVDFQVLRPRWRLLDERTDPVDDFARAVAVRDNAIERLFQLLEIGRRDSMMC